MNAPDDLEVGSEQRGAAPALSAAEDITGAPGHDLMALLLGLQGQWDEAAARLQKLERHAATTTTLMDALADVEAPAPEVAVDESGASAAEHEPFDMRTLVEWVRENVVQVVERAINTQATKAPYWCRRWWEHPEAIVRFEASRLSWAAAVTQPDCDAMSTYLQHLDHHLSVLMGSDGPFSRCKPTKHHQAALSARYLGQDEPDEAFYTREDTAHTASASLGATAELGGPDRDGATRPTPYPRGDTGSNGSNGSNGSGTVRGVDQHRVARGRGW